MPKHLKKNKKEHLIRKKLRSPKISLKKNYMINMTTYYNTYKTKYLIWYINFF